MTENINFKVYDKHSITIHPLSVSLTEYLFIQACEMNKVQHAEFILKTRVSEPMIHRITKYYSIINYNAIYLRKPICGKSPFNFLKYMYEKGNIEIVELLIKNGILNKKELNEFKNLKKERNL